MFGNFQSKDAEDDSKLNIKVTQPPAEKGRFGSSNFSLSNLLKLPSIPWFGENTVDRVKKVSSAADGVKEVLSSTEAIDKFFGEADSNVAPLAGAGCKQSKSKAKQKDASENERDLESPKKREHAKDESPKKKKKGRFRTPQLSLYLDVQYTPL